MWPECHVSSQVAELGRTTCPGWKLGCHIGLLLSEAKGE
jgi:hypothetical protein